MVATTRVVPAYGGSGPVEYGPGEVIDMEIAPVPRRSTRGERRRLLVGFLVLTPLLVLVLLPGALGFDRFVVTHDHAAGGHGEGAVVFAREVPASDLRAGDVVAFGSDTGVRDGDRITRTILAVDGDVALVSKNGTDAATPILLGDQPYSRVWLTIPWLGYPFLVDSLWVLLGCAALGLAAVLVLRRRGARAARRRASGPGPAAQVRRGARARPSVGVGGGHPGR